MEGHRYLPFKILFYAVGIVLTAVIAVWGYQTFLSSASIINTTNNPSINCVGLVYRVQETSYSDGVFRFTFLTEKYSREDITGIVVESDSATTSVNATVPMGMSRSFSVPIVASGNVSVYPAGCAVYRKVVLI